VALAALSIAEQRFDQGHRIAGLGGEVARGFYYLGRPRDPAVTRARVARLARWRMFANEAIDPLALAPDLRRDATDRAVDRIHGLMAATGKPWLPATDDFYLYQRMQRWAGVTDTAVCLDRSLVNPMLDDRFIAIAQGMPPESKRGSLFLATLQMALDPVLGRMPLDGRPPPEAYARPGLVNRARAVQTLARKAATKARQRLGHSTRPPAGGTVLATKVVQQWRSEPALLDRAREHTVLDETWLDHVVAGDVDPAPSSVAFVLNVASLPDPRRTADVE
jgi:asparagine synthase (glutamine-hydrolysing)